MRRRPHVALIAGAVAGYLVALLVWYLSRQGGTGAAQVVAALLYMAVFGAVISYALQCLSFIMLRVKLPNIERPYRSRWGIPGAAIAGIIALVSLVTMFTNDDYRPGLYGVAAYYVLGVIYFAIAGRHRLVLSPEEEFALTKGERGVPEVSYDTSAAAQEAVLRGETTGASSSSQPPSETPSG